MQIRVHYLALLICLSLQRVRKADSGLWWPNWVLPSYISCMLPPRSGADLAGMRSYQQLVGYMQATRLSHEWEVLPTNNGDLQLGVYPPLREVLREPDDLRREAGERLRVLRGDEI